MYLVRETFVLESSRNFKGCSLLVGAFPKDIHFRRASTDVRVWKGNHYPNLPHSLSVIMHKKLSWDNLYQYLQTRSSLHTFQERYPETGDISRKLWDDLRKGMEKEGDVGKGEVQIEFPLAILLARRA